ncbi:hypothetical protein Q0Z83_042290 [Actinoplanes sichuanensis]|uniref:WD40 repeat domain-containing serine/threonine protein kinase n=1 Tax=Actinoplanes sichuanensis TaxID=512349 RepID=A0ABW4AXB4_9ACTN|nr:protein kinase [Actinoplanes sichuanensis]BEL06038.1 hypothetical protein Q0Z83_042290 [Actinoplanes sichuanensis]
MATEAVRMIAGRYRLAAAVGRGGMGAVWRAYDTLLDREVAVKQIWIAGADELDDPDDPLVRRALREAQATARIRHPHVVTVHDVVTDRGRPWLVMELISGQSLAQAITEHGLLTPRRTAQIGLPVLQALQAAHRAGIIHRDVKPANIMVDDTGRVVLTDFGIAMVGGKTALTATGQLLGSPSYLAPERINGRQAGPASDLWALGVTLYTAVTGRSPFQREDTQATVAAVLTAEPPAPAHAGRLWPVIKGLLAKDPDRRLTAEQAAPLLTKAAEPDDTSTGQGPGSARPATGHTRRRRPAASRRTGTDSLDDVPATLHAPPPTLAAPTGHLPSARPQPQTTPPEPPPVDPGHELATVTAVTASSSSSPQDLADRADLEPDRAPVTGHTADTRPIPAAVSAPANPSAIRVTVLPAQRIPADLPSSRTRARRTIAAGLAVIVIAAAAALVWQLKRPDTPTVAGLPTWTMTSTFTGHSTAAGTVAYSPDGEHLAIAGDDKTVRVWNLGTGEVRTLTGHTGEVRSVSYSPDGTHLATAGSDKTVRVWNLGTGKPSILTGHTDIVDKVVYSPDGHHLATGGWDKTVRVWDLGTGESRAFTGHTKLVNEVVYSPDGHHLVTTGLDDTARVWDLGTGESRTLTGHTNMVAEVAYSPDGRHLGVGSLDGAVRVWDLGTEKSRTLTGNVAAPLHSMVYSPDGRHLAATGFGDTIRVWNLDTGLSRVLTGHIGPVGAVAYSPDGRHLATSGSDKTVRVWDAETGESQPLTGHPGVVSEVLYSPDGRHLATVGLDNTVRIWTRS